MAEAEGRGFSPAVKPRKKGALAPEASPFHCGRIFMRWVVATRTRSFSCLLLRYRTDDVIISRGLIASRRGGYMVNAARASAPCAASPHSARHFLTGRTAIRIARNSPENNALNFSNPPKRACLRAPFSHVSGPKNHESRVAVHHSPITTHHSRISNR
jgi:hypothetical protein